MLETDLRSLELYPFWHSEVVRFGDMDALGHVNNNKIGTYFECARVGLLQAAWDEWWRQDSYVVLAGIAIDFLTELQHPATVRVGVAVEKVGNSSFVLVSAIFNGQACVSVARATCVLVDSAHRKSRKLSEAQIAALKRFSR